MCLLCLCFMQEICEAVCTCELKNICHDVGHNEEAHSRKIKYQLPILLAYELSLLLTEGCSQWLCE